MKKVLFSGIQPSGNLMIGNYIGAIKHWVNLQNEFQSYFALVDLHTITVKQDPNSLRNRCYDFLALYIACGIDPEKNVIFVQSHVPAHAELAWILNCFTYMGELNRMTQFKDKSARYTSNINVGLYDYPVLMAADILLYDTNLVPVGHDQKQHLELTRDLAIRFNNIYGDVFAIPEPYIPPLGGRIMGLQEPLKKMSKSDENEHNYIALLDSPDLIRKKMQRAVTDSGREIKMDPEKPGVSNLLTLLSAITNVSIENLELRYQHEGYGTFKKEVAEAIIDFLSPIQEKFHQLRNDEKKMHQILREGAALANKKSKQTLSKVQDCLGLIPTQLHSQATDKSIFNISE
ncbi:MAG: tryptophan--tRNA ligase [Gammaproteobacteria bacterium]|nr:tryptophan--tRNA ligase [Gammaproteobacteria bacterium]